MKTLVKTNTAELSTGKKIISVIIGALLLGFLWRVRGTGGWGSSWGLLNAGFVFSMFIALIIGDRQKMNFGWLATTSFAFMLTSPSWGTLLNQITGVLHRDEFWQVGDPSVYVSVPSALFMMLTMGFGLSTVFAIMLGRGYSEKQWKIKDFVIVLAAFYIFDILSKATVAHWILDWVQPEAGEIFQEGLKIAGIDGTPHEVFLQHFNDLAWSKKFQGGRNYFSSIQAISSTFRSIGALLATRFIVKDKISAKVGLVVSGAFAFSITVSDIFFYFGNGGYHMQGTNPFPEWFAVWSNWEYFTGFIAGAIITAFLISLPKKSDVPEIAFRKMPKKWNTALTFIVAFIGMIGLNIVRPVIERLEDTKLYILYIVIAVLATLGVIFAIFKAYGFNAKNVSPSTLYSLLLPLMLVYIIIAYLFIAIPEEQNFRSITQLHNILCLLSVAATLIWTFRNNKIKLH